MGLNNISNHSPSYAKGALDIYKGKAEQERKRLELKRYFPGIDFHSKQRSSYNAGMQEAKTDFAKQLGSRLEQKKLSRVDIQKEIQKDPEKKKFYQAALDFQALFIDRMLSAMRKNLNPKSDFLYGGFRQKIFEDMLYEEYSRMLSSTDNFGLADDIYRQGRATLESSSKKDS